MLANFLLLGLSVVPWLWAYGLSYLLWHESQRAEYLADLLATRLSGTAAMLAMLEKFHYTNAFQQTVREIALSPTPLQLVETFRRTIAKIPAREVERIRRVERLQLVSLDATHPPTVYRIEFLKAHPIEQPEFVLDAVEAEQLEQEVLRAQSQIQQKLVDSYISSLH
jgi:heat shock protein HtpX